MEAMPSDGLRRRQGRRHTHRTEENKIRVESLFGHRIFSLWRRHPHRTKEKRIRAKSLFSHRIFSLWRRHPHRTEEKRIHVESLFGHSTSSLELDLTETIANDDHRTLADYGVKHGSSSSLLLNTSLHGGDPPEKEGTGSHCMEAMTSEELRRPSQGAKSIFVKIGLSSASTNLGEVDLSKTIEDVKDMIFEKEGIPPTQQRLILVKEGIPLVEAQKEWYTLKEYGFQYGTYSYIRVILRLRGGAPDPEINIFVTKLDGETFTVRLHSLTTPIYEVRRLIRDLEDIRQTQQHLVFCGQPLDHDRTLADYNIQNNSILHLAPGPCGVNSGLHERLSKDEDGLVKTGQVNEEGSRLGHDQQSSGSQSQPLVLCHHEGRSEQIMEASSEITVDLPSMGVGVNDTALPAGQFIKQQMIRWSKYSANTLVFAITTFVTYLGSASTTLFSTNDTALPTDQFIRQQKIRWSKYSVKALVFAITTFVTYLGSASTLFSNGNMVFKISIGSFFIADATLSMMMPPKMGSALVYFSCFLLVLVSYLLLVSFNKYYGYAILPAPLPFVAALLQHKLLSGLTRQQRINSEGDQQNGEEDEEHFDRIFELSADIVNCGGLITVVFGNSMVGPVSAVGFFFFYTMALGLYLMMVTTVRTAVLKPHAKYLAILLKVLLVITLITALIQGVRG